MIPYDMLAGSFMERVERTLDRLPADQEELRKSLELTLAAASGNTSSKRDFYCSRTPGGLGVFYRGRPVPVHGDDLRNRLNAAGLALVDGDTIRLHAELVDRLIRETLGRLDRSIVDLESDHTALMSEEGLDLSAVGEVSGDLARLRSELKGLKIFRAAAGRVVARRRRHQEYVAAGKRAS